MDLTGICIGAATAEKSVIKSTVNMTRLLQDAMFKYALNSEYDFAHETLVYGDFQADNGVKSGRSFRDYFVSVYSGATPILRGPMFSEYTIEDSPLTADGDFKCPFKRNDIIKEGIRLGKYSHGKNASSLNL